MATKKKKTAPIKRKAPVKKKVPAKKNAPAKKKTVPPPTTAPPATPQPSAPSPALPRPTGKTPSVRIRMYRVGFGDCFLVTLAGTHQILVDCGVHNRGKINVNGDDLLHKAFLNIQKETGNKLDIVIATHAHQDHVSGYGTFADQFKQFEIGEVWMPWTEDPSDPTARQWRTRKQSLVGLLQQSLAATADTKAAAAVENAIANPAAMEALRTGFGKAKVRYLKAGNKVDAPSGITGFSANILGPPQDEIFLTKMNPPGSDHFLRMAIATAKGKTVHPFARWELTAEALLSNWPQLGVQAIRMISAGAVFPAAEVAFSLDKLLNNTSIVALFSWAGKQMLFPGDAQYGDWAYWYKKTGAQVLSDICFYKVAHHGSMNATPKGALEEMPKGKFGAMASTQSTPWPSIPEPALMKAIDEQAAGVARSDAIPVKGVTPVAEPGTLPAQFEEGDESKGEYWMDYIIP
jgi:beta-lactamase superfamily II metal-dependent hydrolase